MNLRHPVLVWTALVVSPLLLAALVLAWRPWAPTLDMAMTEYRLRDVGGRDTPLIGLPGRIGEFPDQGSHPGPWSFYLLAPVWWLTGERAWGMELGSAVINACTLAVALWLGSRLHRTYGVLLVAAVAAVAVRGYGLSVLTHPWNPYFPVLIWLVVLLATWLVVRGDHRMLPIVVTGSSVAAQTHIPYLLNGLAMCALAFAAVWWHRRSLAKGDEGDRRASTRSLLIGLGAGAVLWIPPLVDQLARDPGNVRMIAEHFLGEPSDERIALGDAVRVFFRHLDALAVVPDLFTQADAFVHRSGLPGGNGWGGLLMFAAWGAAAWWARQRRHRTLTALNIVIAVALVVQLVSISRIFGKVWYYLTLWAWGTTLLVVVSTLWTLYLALTGWWQARSGAAGWCQARSGPSGAAGWCQARSGLSGAAGWCQARSGPSGAADGAGRARNVPDTNRGRDTLRQRWIGVALATFAVVFTVISLGATRSLEVPDPQLSGPLRTVLPDTVASLDAGVGPAAGRDATYVVFWQDALFIGAQGYGLVNELERRGFDVGVHETWRVPVTQHRVLPFGAYDAEVHLVTGGFIDEWRDREGFVEVAYADDRSATERERFDELHGRVVARLHEIGRDDLVGVLDQNLFGASLDPDLPQDLVDDMSAMIEIGVPVAVFVAPPGSSF